METRDQGERLSLQCYIIQSDQTSRSLGTISVYILGSVMDWFRLAWLGLVFPLVAALVLLQSPESPVYLVTRGRMAEAETTLKRLNSDSYDPASDMEDILTSIHRSNSNTSRNKMNTLKSIHRYPEIYKPFLIIFFLR